MLFVEDTCVFYTVKKQSVLNDFFIDVSSEQRMTLFSHSKSSNH